MQITNETLRALSQGFKSEFLRGIEAVNPQWNLVAMTAASNTDIENYAFLKELPGMKEWVGELVFNNLESYNYQVKNKLWAEGLSVKKIDIEDDRLGIYSNRFAMLGEAAAAHKDLLVWETLLGGFNTAGMDGQYFFDTDHVGYTAAGVATSYSNTGGGASAPWFLMDLSRSFMKPLIMQERKALEFISKDSSTDDNVFYNNEFHYKTEARYAAGYGFHQLAYGSKVALDASVFASAKAAMMTQRKPSGQVLNVMPTHLICGPTNEAAARALLSAQQLASGASNVWYNNVQLVVIPQLG